MVYQMNKTIYWSLLAHEDWNLYMAATSEGLCYVGSLNQSVEELMAWARSRFPGSPLVEEDTVLQPYAKELIEYFQGERTHFTLPVDFHGTTLPTRFKSRTLFVRLVPLSVLIRFWSPSLVIGSLVRMEL